MKDCRREANRKTRVVTDTLFLREGKETSVRRSPANVHSSFGKRQDENEDVNEVNSNSLIRHRHFSDFLHAKILIYKIKQFGTLQRGCVLINIHLRAT
jgi:hypothetical protein